MEYPVMKKPLDDLKALLKLFFDVTPTSYQLNILNAIFKEKCRKITVRSTTRAGKSFIVAISAIIYAIFKDNVRVGIIAPTKSKTHPIMGYIAELLSFNPIFDTIVMLDTRGMTKLERLRKEVSKERITFTNGSSIEIKTVDINRKGFGVMGFGYNFTIVDETAEIPDSVYSKIYRMLVEDVNAMLLEIGNPWHLDHFYEHHHDLEWKKIHVRWQDCVAAGRMTQKAVDDQRRNMTPLEFKVLFDAEFPEELEYSVFSKEAIENCTVERVLPENFVKYLIGVDVAQGGRDQTVITILGQQGRHFYFVDSREMNTRDVMQIVGMTNEIVDYYGRDRCYITVDGIGVGAGVHARLKELQYHSRDFIAGKSPRSPRYYNRKSEAVFGVAKMMKDERVFNIPRQSRYVLELRSWIFEVRSDKQLRVVDPDKSPDAADSLMLALANEIYEDLPAFIGKEEVYKRRVPKANKPSMFRSRRKRR